MKVSQTENGFIASHVLMGLNDEGVECKLENWEHRCTTLEEAQDKAQKYLESRNIQEEIVCEGIPVPDGQPIEIIE